jgi:hypothetical protein
MQKLLLAATAALALNASAQAIEVEYYGGTEEFAKQVANCYDKAPPALLAYIEKPIPRVVVAKDFDTLVKLDGVYGFTAGFLKQHSNSNFSGLAMHGSAKSGVLRSLSFVESHHTTPKFVEHYTCKVVMHEIMHLYDFSYGNDKAEKSDAPEFQKAFKEDVAHINMMLKKNPKDKELKKDIGMFSHYMGRAKEAFAEAGATIVYFHDDARWYEMMSVLFPQVMTLVKAELVKDKIISADYVGKALAPKPADAPAPSGKVTSELRP